MSSYTHFDLTIDEDRVAWLTIDVAGRSVNVLAQEVMNELGAAVRTVASEKPQGFVFRSGKPRGFIFGADVN